MRDRFVLGAAFVALVSGIPTRLFPEAAGYGLADKYRETMQLGGLPVPAEAAVFLVVASVAAVVFDIFAFSKLRRGLQVLLLVVEGALFFATALALRAMVV